MSAEYPFIPPHLEKGLEDLSIPLIDLLHGHLKVAMLDSEEQLSLAQQAEDESGEAVDSMERKYWEGHLEALTDIYALTYNLSIDRQQIERDHHAKLGI